MYESKKTTTDLFGNETTAETQYFESLGIIKESKVYNDGNKDKMYKKVVYDGYAKKDGVYVPATMPLPNSLLQTAFNAFGKIEHITDDSNHLDMKVTYGPDQERWLSLLTDDSTGKTVRKTIYAGNFHCVTRFAFDFLEDLSIFNLLNMKFPKKWLFLVILQLCCFNYQIEAQNDSTYLALLQTTKQVEELFDKEPHKDIFLPFRSGIVSELDWYKHHNSILLHILDKLYLEDNLAIHKLLAKEWDRETFVYVQTDYIGYVADSSLMNAVCLKEMTRISCWQWVLLFHLRHFIKDGVDYHVRQSLIKTEEEWKAKLESLQSFVIPDTKMIESPTDICDISEWDYQRMKEFRIPQSPIIIIDKEQNTVYVRFYTWNSWKGLSENHLLLKIIGGNQLRAISCDSRVVFPFSLGL